VEQLGSPEFHRREAASRRLVALGDRALPALQTAALEGKDAEGRRRAARAVEAIERQTWYDDTKKLLGAWKAVGLEEEGKALLSESYFGSVAFQWNLHAFWPISPSELALTELLQRSGMSDTWSHPCHVLWEMRIASIPEKRGLYPRTSARGVFMLG